MEVFTIVSDLIYLILEFLRERRTFSNAFYLICSVCWFDISTMLLFRIRSDETNSPERRKLVVFTIYSFLNKNLMLTDGVYNKLSLKKYSSA